MLNRSSGSGVLPLAPREFVLLELAPPGARPTAIGVLLFHPATGRLEARLRDDIGELCDSLGGESLEPCEREALEGLAGQLERDIRDETPEACLRRIENSFSNIVRAGERLRAGARSLDALFHEYVQRPRVPLYSLRAAAGKFGEDMEAEPEASVEVPPHVPFAPDLFAVHIVGHSMEPLAPDGCIALFRPVSAGSRQGKRVLVWREGAAGGEFTLKVYRSEKRYLGGDAWEHAGIVLEPLNPDYDPLTLEDAGTYRVIGEFAGVA